VTSSLFTSSVRPKLAGRAWSPAGVSFSVNGTGDPSPSDTYNQLGSFASNVDQLLMQQADGLWMQQPIGYEAAVTNMKDSYMNAVDQIVAALGGPPCDSYQASVYESGPFVLKGYSQGSCATDIVWQQYVYPQDGILHHRIDDCMHVINFGDVFRTENIANGNVYQQIPIPGMEDGSPTGGIGQAANNLTVAESTYINPTNPLGLPVVMSYDLPGDLYGASPQGDAGIIGQSIMNIIFTTDFTEIVSVLKDLAHPIAIFEEIANAIGFFAAGTNAPHWQYANAGCVQSATDLMIALGNALPHQPGS
jgi:hypothetical protein